MPCVSLASLHPTVPYIRDSVRDSAIDSVRVRVWVGVRYWAASLAIQIKIDASSQGWDLGLRLELSLELGRGFGSRRRVSNWDWVQN